MGTLTSLDIWVETFMQNVSLLTSFLEMIPIRYDIPNYSIRYGVRCQNYGYLVFNFLKRRGPYTTKTDDRGCEFWRIHVAFGDSQVLCRGMPRTTPTRDSLEFVKLSIILTILLPETGLFGEADA